MRRRKVTLDKIQRCLNLCLEGKARCMKMFVNGTPEYEVVAVSGEIQLQLTQRERNEHMHLIEEFINEHGADDGLFEGFHQTTKFFPIPDSPKQQMPWEYGD